MENSHVKIDQIFDLCSMYKKSTKYYHIFILTYDMGQTCQCNGHSPQSRLYHPPRKKENRLACHDVGPYHNNCDGEVKKIISFYRYKVMMY